MIIVWFQVHLFVHVISIQHIINKKYFNSADVFAISNHNAVLFFMKRDPGSVKHIADS